LKEFLNGKIAMDVGKSKKLHTVFKIESIQAMGEYDDM